MEQMTAEEMFKMIKDLEKEEKQELLNLLYDEYYDGGGAVLPVIEK